MDYANIFLKILEELLEVEIYIRLGRGAMGLIILKCERRCIWEWIIGLDSATLLKTGLDVDIGIKKASRSSAFRGEAGTAVHLEPGLAG